MTPCVMQAVCSPRGKDTHVALLAAVSGKGSSDVDVS